MRLGAALAIGLVGCGGFLGLACDDETPSSATPPGSNGGDGSPDASTSTGESDGGSATDASKESDGSADACSGGACTRRVFVTNGTYNGNLGGVAGADQKCQAAGDLFVPGRQWKAWVSILGNAAILRLSLFKGPYVTGAAPIPVANDWAGFASDSHLARIVSELDAPPSDNELVWSGTDPTGVEIGSDCDGWMSSLSTAFAVVGNASALDSTWSNLDTQECSQQLHLYCVEQ